MTYNDLYKMDAGVSALVKQLNQPDGIFTHFNIEGVYADDTIYGSKVTLDNKGNIINQETGISYPFGAYPFDMSIDEIESLKNKTRPVRIN